MMCTYHRSPPRRGDVGLNICQRERRVTGDGLAVPVVETWISGFSVWCRIDCGPCAISVVSDCESETKKMTQTLPPRRFRNTSIPRIDCCFLVLLIFSMEIR